MLEQILNPFRRKPGTQFRKSLGVFNFKIGKIGTHKQANVIPFNTKKQMMETGGQDLHNRIREKERNSQRLFGSFTKSFQYIIQGGFKFDQTKVPFFNIPSLENFKLRPYVSVHTPQVSQELKDSVLRLNDFKLEENFNRYQEQLVNEIPHFQNSRK